MYCFFTSITPAIASAQIATDGTLPTVVEEEGENIKITGGQREGNNLFHSLEEFSIPEGMEAVFENAPDIENIFTRVTGEGASSINGILTTMGGANFFLINPNGIIFGENAQLNVGGSFIATTADSIEFADGTEFAAKDTSEKPLLTVNAPIGLGFSSNSGAITVNGNGNQITPSFSFSPTEVSNSKAGLDVAPGKTLALIANNITIDGGTINAKGGGISLVSVSDGEVNFRPTENGFTFNFENVTNHNNIDLTNQTVLNASGRGKGDISLTAQNIAVRNGSLVLVQNLGDINSGTISINTTDSLTLSGTSPDGNISSAIRSETRNSRKGADIYISTKELKLQNGARIGATTYGDGLGGNITIDSTNSVQLLENSLVNPNRQTFLTSSIANSTYGSGDAGSLQLSTSQLKVTDGGAVVSSTIGTGNGGDITINAKTIEVTGVKPERNTFSSISASSVGAGDAGIVTVKTSELRVTDGATFSSSSFATGNAGSLTVDASRLVEVSGKNNDVPSRIRTSVDSVDSNAAQKRLGLTDLPSGNSGNVTIKAPVLNVNQGGEISVRNDGNGDAGILSLNAEEINLTETGSISATSFSGSGGNINVDTDFLQLDSESSITARADNSGNGGNITINTTNIIAKKNSEIVAQAERGNGGNILINTSGAFISTEALISADSQLGIDGTVEINVEDDEYDFVELLNSNFLDPEELIASSCLGRTEPSLSSFVVNGGGLPISPDTGFQQIPPLTGFSAPPSSNATHTEQNAPSIQPAQAMVTTREGKVMLVTGTQLKTLLGCQID